MDHDGKDHSSYSEADESPSEGFEQRSDLIGHMFNRIMLAAE